MQMNHIGDKLLKPGNQPSRRPPCKKAVIIPKPRLSHIPQHTKPSLNSIDNHIATRSSHIIAAHRLHHSSIATCSSHKATMPCSTRSSHNSAHHTSSTATVEKRINHRNPHNLIPSPFLTSHLLPHCRVAPWCDRATRRFAVTRPLT